MMKRTILRTILELRTTNNLFYIVYVCNNLHLNTFICSDLLGPNKEIFVAYHQWASNEAMRASRHHQVWLRVGLSKIFVAIWQFLEALLEASKSAFLAHNESK
jgi:hypothetical protein